MASLFPEPTFIFLPDERVSSEREATAGKDSNKTKAGVEDLCGAIYFVLNAADMFVD